MAVARAARQFRVDVNQKYCKGCEICVQVCPKDILFVNDRQKAQIQNVETCTGCLSCEVYCPDFAIKVTEVESNG